MKLRSLIALSGLVVAFAAFGALAPADKAAKQSEVQKAAAASLDRFYAKKVGLKDAVKKAPGYAVFTSFGMSFVFGGAGGGGLAHDNKTGKDTYMSMAQASAGLQAGIAQRDTLIIFKTRQALENFIAKGWEYSGEVAAGVGAGGKSAGGAAGEQAINEAMTYSLTKSGLEAGGMIAGTKFWKHDELN